MKEHHFSVYAAMTTTTMTIDITLRNKDREEGVPSTGPPGEGEGEEEGEEEGLLPCLRVVSRDKESYS